MPRDTSRWRAGQYLGAPHSRVWFSLTMKAKLRGFFGQAQRHVSLAGDTPPWRGGHCPSAPWSVLVRSQLSSRGFSSDARPRDMSRWRGGQYIDAPHSRNSGSP
ncbi:hypothetical protein G5714_024575 [Onychostoma macrolepis]|uniref:Uncharacterized protein n=1 Tax=Onychostoma macrolepis TaxID=369639 RepID=A0A7J6BIF3_9TELE|nr:hypothetical protein G5714_024575 [Onychostoma macrolepis]